LSNVNHTCGRRLLEIFTFMEGQVSEVGKDFRGRVLLGSLTRETWGSTLKNIKEVKVNENH